MFSKILLLIIRNTMRAMTRSVITVTACTLAAFVVCFFLAAENSMVQLTSAAAADANIVVRQKDRF